LTNQIKLLKNDINLPLSSRSTKRTNNNIKKFRSKSEDVESTNKNIHNNIQISNFSNNDNYVKELQLKIRKLTLEKDILRENSQMNAVKVKELSKALNYDKVQKDASLINENTVLTKQTVELQDKIEYFCKLLKNANIPIIPYKDNNNLHYSSDRVSENDTNENLRKYDDDYNDKKNELPSRKINTLRDSDDFVDILEN